MQLPKGTLDFDYDRGVQAHRAGDARTTNPYLARAIMWDKGFVTSARAETASTNAATRIVGFKEWISIQ